MVFGTADNLRHISNSDTIFADGTFYANPILFKQLYTIHAFIEGEMFPLVFAFLPEKMIHLLRKIKKYHFQLNFDLCQK